ncbi:MAG: hypothetical protein B7Z15_17285 [Rhizobiales bacterium 32-66-8]|nr:MAG: hypothetical protein B7Z15_17285 [Rhizobiales bacterium 32-66-8]
MIGRALLPRRRRGFARDEGGATLIEFGLLALPFFSIVGAILETSVVFLSSQVLESAVQDVSRLIRTGQAQGTMESVDAFRDRVCSRLYGLFADCDGLFVEVKVITNFNDASISAPIADACTLPCDWTRLPSYTPSNSSNIVLVQVYYKWPVMLSLGDLSLANLPGNQRLMGAATVFRNEPF